MTHRLLILSRHADSYRRHVEDANLPDLEIVSISDLASLPESATLCDLVFGEPSLIAKVLPRMPGVRWIQATWAGVEPLLDRALRRDYTLTNARGVFGVLMTEYVFGYMLAHERRMFEKFESQKRCLWDTRPPGSLRGKTIGLLGVGTIGASLASTAKHFGMIVRGTRVRAAIVPTSTFISTVTTGSRLRPASITPCASCQIRRRPTG